MRAKRAMWHGPQQGQSVAREAAPRGALAAGAKDAADPGAGEISV
jgi:hypothetical protein